MDGLIKAGLQRERNKGNMQKTVANNATKNMAEQQEAIA